MKLRWTLALASLLAGVLPVGAQPANGTVNFVEHTESGRSVRIKSKPRVQKLNAASHILCMDVLRTGTRIKKRRCQTIADWKSEIGDRRIRMYLLEM